MISNQGSAKVMETKPKAIKRKIVRSQTVRCRKNWPSSARTELVSAQKFTEKTTRKRILWRKLFKKLTRPWKN